MFTAVPSMSAAVVHIPQRSPTRVVAMSLARQTRPTKVSASKGSSTAIAATAKAAEPQTEAEGTKYAKSLPGIMAPFPNMFDPLKLSASVAPAEVKRWRESELTHGRLAMLATVGWWVGETQYVENNPLFNGAVNGPALGQFQQVEAQAGSFWELLVVGIGVAELYRALTGWKNPIGGDSNVLKDSYVPGNLGWDPLNLEPDTAEKLLNMQNKELNNGRLAMIGIAGMVAQEEIDGMKVFEHLTQYGFTLHG